MKIIVNLQSCQKNKDIRLAKISSGDKKSPYYKFCQAEIKLHWALSRLKFEEYFTALKEIKSAHDLLSENSELYPGFILNKKSLSAIHALIGTFPDTYRNLLKHVQWPVRIDKTRSIRSSTGNQLHKKTRKHF